MSEVGQFPVVGDTEGIVLAPVGIDESGVAQIAARRLRLSQTRLCNPRVAKDTGRIRSVELPG